jgi:ABC-2 type transport system permease protein
MSAAKVLATSKRILSQLRHDTRTLAILFLVPCLLITLLKYIFQGQPEVFSSIAPMMLAIFPLLMMFLVTSIAMLRERTSGTLDRLMAGPMSKLDLILGYAIAFSMVGLVQACLACFVTLGLLDVTVLGGTLPVIVSAVLTAFLGTSLGLFVSAFAKTEFQAVELVMPILAPQILLCGLFIARDQMARPLQWAADVLPLTYSVDAMKQVSIYTGWTSTFTKDLLIIVLFGVAALVLGSVTIRRQE